MNKKDKKELQKLVDDINKEAKKVIEDYVKNPSDMSGSYHYINENSPCLECDSCLLRKRGFKQANITDPILA